MCPGISVPSRKPAKGKPPPPRLLSLLLSSVQKEAWCPPFLRLLPCFLCSRQGSAWTGWEADNRANRDVPVMSHRATVYTSTPLG